MSTITGGSTVKAFYSTAASHVSGATGWTYFSKYPATWFVISVTVSSFFGNWERAFNGISIGPVSGFARDACLMPVFFY